MRKSLFAPLKVDSDGRVFKKMKRSASVDEDLHSRQIAVYGRENMKKLAGANVLVSGINGLGAEIVIFFNSFNSFLIHFHGKMKMKEKKEKKFNWTNGQKQSNKMN